jgi:hypothetical protein
MMLGPLALTGFGLCIIGLARRNEQKQRRLIEESSPVTATILSSQLTDGYSDGNSAKMAHVTFEYEFDGSRYESSHIRPGGTNFGSDFGSTAQRRAAKYDPGETVTAYVPESDPRLGFLEQTVSTRPHLIMKVIGGGVAAFSLLLTALFLLL